jgi:GxxExxY protein
LELKSIDLIIPVHIAQMINYLKLLQIKRGLILNFNKKILKEGIKRVSI